jgi:tRNA threonylcarbamoyladenosine modification (KEOPS) complex Cgi121 subunit/molybdopterin converting factor small subunit
MITIRLLGGAKKAVGKPDVSLDRPTATISDILDYLTMISTEPHLLQRSNLIIALNDVDSASLQGNNTVVKSGDTLKIVTVVHGGGTHYTLDTYHVSITGIQKISYDPRELVDIIRAQRNNVSIQAVDAKAVYGEEHMLGVLRIALEAEKRNIMLANRCEIELLIRLAGTDQISEAIRRVGLKKGVAGCIIAFSQDNEALRQFEEWIKSEFTLNDSVLKPDEDKRIRLASMLGCPAKLDNGEFLQYLLEKAALVIG